MHIKEYLMVMQDFMFAMPRLFSTTSLTLKRIEDTSTDIKLFYFEKPSSFTYESGQYALWFLPRKVSGKPARMFSFASSPSEDEVMIATHISSSDYKQKLASLTPGEKVKIRGPIGRMTAENAKTLVMIAGGIGITPMRSLIKDIADTEREVKTVLVYNANKEYVFRTELEPITDLASFTSKDELLSIIDGHISSYGNDADYFIAGPPAFTSTVEKHLRQQGITRIKHDGFLGY